MRKLRVLAATLAILGAGLSVNSALGWSTYHNHGEHRHSTWRCLRINTWGYYWVEDYQIYDHIWRHEYNDHNVMMGEYLNNEVFKRDGQVVYTSRPCDPDNNA